MSEGSKDAITTGNGMTVDGLIEGLRVIAQNVKARGGAPVMINVMIPGEHAYSGEIEGLFDFDGKVYVQTRPTKPRVVGGID